MLNYLNFHFIDNIKIIYFILLCILQIKHCIIRNNNILLFLILYNLYLIYRGGVWRINRVIFVYIALIITLVRFFTPIHPSFSNLIYWIFILYLIPIILCVIGFKAEKLIATMVIIPNFLGILYRLYAYIVHIIFM